MKTKDNIHKIINLNCLVNDLKQYFEVITYTEHSFITCVEWYKVHTILYCDNDISLLIVNNKYRLYQSWDGFTIDCDSLEQLEIELNKSIQELEQNV